MARMLGFFCLVLLAIPVVAQQPARPAITGVAFFRAYTTHPEEAQKFYGPTMGFAQRDVDGMWVYPVNRSQWIEVVHEGQPPSATCRMLAVGFTTRDVHALERYLNARGVPTAEPMKNDEFAVRDPEGNLVYFVESPYPTAKGVDKKLTGVALDVSEAKPLSTATSVHMIHVGFIVHDRAKEDTFWRGILGFRPYWHGWGTGHTADDYVSLQVPDGTDWLEYMLNQHNPDLQRTGVMDHFSLGTPRMQEVLAQLQANGCQGKMCTAIQAGVDGKIQLNLYDPDMTRIEYMEFTPVMKPCCSPFTGTHPTSKESE